ncbi:MAG: hypothetical protein ACI8WB_004139 [Phenylobacterium sp.]|jgi:hypothetical protein
MANLVALDNKRHLTTRVNPDKAELHGAGLHLVPVVLSEFTALALQYPIVLSKNEQSGQFVFSAMLGFESGENLFWQHEQWQGLYLPLQIRRQPFFVDSPAAQLGNNSNTAEYIVCMDIDSPTICESTQAQAGVALFDENGQDSEYLHQAKANLSELLSGEAQNQLLLDKLEALDLLQAMSLEITFADQTSRQLKGLYTVDQQKLANLTDQQHLNLYHAGLLPAIYTFISSQGQIHALIDLKNKRLA